MSLMIRLNKEIGVCPLSGNSDLYYRHAKGENLLLVGSEKNTHKNNFLRAQIGMFKRLGWQFITVDMTNDFELGRADFIPDSSEWSMIEKNYFVHIQNPRVAVRTFQVLVQVLDGIERLKREWHLPHTVVVHTGDMRHLTDDEKAAFRQQIYSLATTGDGLWVITEDFQPLPMDVVTQRFHTQIVLPETDEDKYMREWEEINSLQPLKEYMLEEQEAAFLLYGKSEGANGRLMLCKVNQGGDTAWEE